MSLMDDKTVNINIYKNNKDTIENSDNKSETYIIISNEELSNRNRELLESILQLENTISDLENDNERMEKSITYQRGLLHNFNHIKNYQNEQLKEYNKFKSKISETQKFLVNETQKHFNMMRFNIFALCVFSLIFTPYDILKNIINIITIISIFYSSKLIFSYDKDAVSNFMKNYTLNENEFKNKISKFESDIKTITSKSDFISDLIDNS